MEIQVDSIESPKKPTHGFKKGKSGNPGGKPLGALGHKNRLLRGFCRDNALEVMEIVLQKAREGDMQACKLIVERALPPCKDSYIEVRIPVMNTLKDVDHATDIIIEDVAVSNLTPSEGQSFMTFIEGKRKVMETVELENRVAELEKIGREND